MKWNRFKALTWGIWLGIGCLVNPAHARTNDLATHADHAPHVLRATLKNGLRVVIVRDTLAPVVTTQITYLAGSYEAPKGYPGTAHALEHMMFRDSQGMTGAQLNEITGKMGGENNAFTTNDATQYYFLAPSAYLDILLHIEATRMEGAQLSKQDWALEKGAIEQEVSGDISDPDTLTFEKAEAILYAGTGYADDPLGTRQSFDRTTQRTLQDFYERWYAPNNAVLVIVGDIDPQDTLAKVQQLFDPIPARAMPSRAPVALQPFKPRTIRSTTPEGTGSVQFLYRMPGQQAGDAAATQVLMDVLDNARGPVSELAAQGKVLSASVELRAFAHGGIGMIKAGFPRGGDASRAKERLDKTIAQLLQQGVSADLVEAAKRTELAQAELNKNSPQTLASTWSQALAWQGLDSPEQAEEHIRKVTVEDVNRVAREYLKSEAHVTVVLTPSENGEQPADSRGFGGTESFTSNDKLDVPLPDWAAKPLNELAMPHWTLDPADMTLSNGIRLIVQPEHTSKTITVMGHIDNNPSLQEPAGQERVGDLLSSLFDYGSADLARSAFHKALDEIAANESGGADFSLAVPSENFDRGMQLLAGNELHPALLQEGFNVQRDALAQTLIGELQSPEYRAHREAKQRLLPVGDPELREATPTTVNALSLADVRNYYAHTFRPDLTTLVVVGDITPDQARSEVEKYFGDWKAVGPKPEVVPKPVPLNPAGYTVVNDPYASQDTVVMAQMVDVNLHNPDRFALTLGNDVLGGNGFASRLMLDVRVRHGYAYSASSGFQFNRSRSIFIVNYGCDPGKVAPVDALIRSNVVSLQDSPLSASEIANARQFEVRSMPLEVASVDNIAKSLLTWAYLGEPLDEPVVAVKHYLDLTAEQVRDAFNKYLKPKHLVQVVRGPTPPSH